MTDTWTTAQPRPTAPRAGGSARADVDRAAADLDILHLAELVPVIRQRFAVPVQFADDAILGSLQTIARHSSVRDRWRAAFNSNLGAWLAGAGRDLNTALNILLALLPRPTS